MRLPVSKVYRAFPELDRFSDADCARFVALAKRRQRLLQLAIGAGGGLGGLALGLLVAWLLALVLGWLGAGQTATFRDLLFGLIAAGIIVAVLAAPGLGVLIARDIWLRRALRMRIDVARCACGYSLLGLRPVHAGDGVPEVTCPECGLKTGLDPDAQADSDVLAGRAREGIGVRVRERVAWQRPAIVLGLVVGVVTLLTLLALLFSGMVPAVADVRAYVHNRVWVPVGLYLSIVAAYACGFVPAWMLNRTLTRD